MSNNITRFRVKQKPWLAVGVAAPRVAAERVDAPRVAAEGVIESVGGMGVVNNALETLICCYIPGLLLQFLSISSKTRNSHA